jgi:hydroxyacylglutathione hydrolase
MKVRQFRYSADNLGYIVYGNKKAMAVDGGAVDEMLAFIRSSKLELRFVTNTHMHPDHTTGNRELISKTGAGYMDIEKLIEDGAIEIEGNKVDVFHTPGHTADSIVFRLDNTLISGDTLFNGKMGRCFTGDLKSFFESANFLLKLPEDTIIYAGHDYVEEYMAFAKNIEPNNNHIDEFLSTYNPGHVYSTLADELKINPHLRFNDPAIISVLEKRGLPVGTPYDRWASIMSIE